MKKMYLLAVIALITHFSFGAELFVRVMRSGLYVATAYNQTQTNTTNIYRFFELPGGYTTLQISDQQSGLSVYNGGLNIGSNQRVVAEVDYYGNLQVLQTAVIATTNWYTIGNPGTVGYAPSYGNPYPVSGGIYSLPHPSADQAFQQFLGMMDNEAFDSDKLNFAKGYANKTMLSAQQVTEISKRFTFDSNRLDWSKHAYGRCYDKANYFLLKSTFTFSSNYSALKEYIEYH